MKTKHFILGIALVLIITTGAFADNIDVSGSLMGLYSISLDIAPDGISDLVFVFDYGTRSHSKMVDSKGDMSAAGHYEVWEGRKSDVMVGVGYRAANITPWVAMAGLSTRTTKSEMKLKEGQLVKSDTNLTDPVKGVAFGLNAEHWQGDWGVMGTAAKIPDGFLLKTLLKHNISGIGTAHVGYLYSSHLGHGIVVGLGIAY